jgi:lipopolysaccharide/colanic/teichoic acid biosynthesis glycosyltransferase/bifunctional N-acetylglucosamine-1-phosphate-uridyltransferase/glucosamine-1-phosphate-acetyltransferase GlmU-like protein
MAVEPRRAIILAGGAGVRAWSTAWSGSKLALDLGGETVLERQCSWLAGRGIRHALVVGGSAGAASAGPGRVRGVELEWRVEELPVGTAGALRAAASFVGDESFVVLGEHVVPFDLALPSVEPAHWGRSALVAAFVEPRPAVRRRLLRLDAAGFVHAVDRDGHDADAQREAVSAGVYLLHPRALEHVPAGRYFDLQEQLIPAVIEAGYRVETIPVRSGQLVLLSEPRDVLSAMHRRFQRRECGDDEREIAPGVWVRGRVEIDASAQLVGPVLLDDGGSIGSGARIVGPAFIGPEARVEANALVRESVVGRGSRVGADAAVHACLLGQASRVKRGEALTGVMRADGDLAFEFDRVPVVADPRRPASLRSRLYQGQKRVLDLLLATLGLVVAAPLLLLVALAVRLDSPGPVFYLQRRCGRGGREFWLVKFRTMRVSAERELDDLRALSERDGPVFKLAADPRTTRLGRLLRRSSLDELPQLVNVVLGQMSLVGPRPLRRDEMRYAPQWRDLRLSVKPGLTGPWQCYARQSNAFGDWVRHDNDYVLGHGSLWRDLSLIWQTGVGILSGRLRGR